MKRKAVVTGLGIVSPLGNSKEEFWSGLQAGKSGVCAVDRFDTSNFDSRIGALVRNFDGAAYMDKKELRRTDLIQQYALAATQMAVADAALDLNAIDLTRIGVVTGSGIGGILTFEDQCWTYKDKGPSKVSPFFIPMMIIDIVPGLISIKYGFKGPNYATVSACCSSAHALADAMRIIQRGEADIIVTGGAEAAITQMSYAGFCQARALSTRNDDPEHASRPFDIDRDGFVIGEGAAIIILEDEEHARKRGVPIYADLLGAGMSADAHHITAPAPDGNGAARCMQTAVQDAGLTLEQIEYVNTHGTSTPLGDIAETSAIKRVFGDRARSLLVNSTKSMIGHMLGGAGAIEAAATVLQLHHGFVHPTINIQNQDPQCDLDYLRDGGRPVPIKYAISNSFGFGGHNITLTLGKHMNSAG